MNSTDDRMAKIYSLFIGHPYVDNIFNILDELRKRRNSVKDPSEIQHAFIMGPSGVGKTTLIRAYADQNPRRSEIEKDCVPVVRAEIPQPLSAGSFYDSILNALGALLVRRQTIDEKKLRVVHHLKGLGTEILILDEFQHLFSKRNNEEMMDMVKHLANISNVVLVCVGHNEINNLRNNAQYKRRFKVINLPRFVACDDAFINLLWNVERKLHLRNESRLWDKETGVPQWLHETTGGILGFLMPLIQEAARIAITPDDRGYCKERIDKEVLQQAYDAAPDGLSEVC